LALSLNSQSGAAQRIKERRFITEGHHRRR
jgi:hypothetical protein